MIVKKTKELLADSFRELADRKGIKKITVKDITDNCQMAPATFYRHFQNKYDLILWYISNQMQRIMLQGCKEGKSWQELQVEYLKFYAQNKRFLLNVQKNVRENEVFVSNLYQIAASQIRYFLQTVCGFSEDDPQTELYLSFYCCGAAQVISGWLLGTVHAETEEIAAFLDNALPHPLRDRMLKQNERI